ncbi:MAG: DUF1521 domain-containing protein [bacterium]
MLGGIVDKLGVGNVINTTIDRLLPGKLGDIAGDIAGTMVDLQTGNVLGGINNLKDTFQKLTNLMDMPLTDFLGGRRMPIASPSSFLPIGENLAEPHGRLRVEGNTIYTPGGYKIENLGNTNWRITSPNGKTTLIHGDPHVSESDGGRWDWDAKTMSFTLPDGTKITANATAATGVTTDFHVYYGNQRVSATGVDTGNPRVSNVNYDAYAHDARMDDGSRVFLGGDGDDWFKESAGGREIVGGGGYSALKLGREFWGNGGFNIAESMLNDERRRKVQEAAARLAAGGNIEDVIMSIMSGLLDDAEKDLRSAVGGLGKDPSQKELMELQLKMQKFQRLYDMFSNMMKTFHETQMTTVRALKA